MGYMSPAGEGETVGVEADVGGGWTGLGGGQVAEAHEGPG